MSFVSRSLHAPLNADKERQTDSWNRQKSQKNSIFVSEREDNLFRNGPDKSEFWTTAASRGGAPQASYDKRSCRPGWLRNYFHKKSSQVSDHFACILKKSKHLFGSEVSWRDHPLAQTPKEAFSEIKVNNGTTQANFEVDNQPATCRFSTRRYFADSTQSSRNRLITMVKRKRNG